MKDIKNNHNTVDSSTYYSRHKPTKAVCVKEFVTRTNGINKIYDVGCNNGEISKPLLDLGLEVSGVDLATDLNLPTGFKYKRLDVVNEDFIEYNDCTIFLSLYHHILGKYGIEIADEVFMKLLLRTKYLIFDSGNLSEIQRLNHAWMIEQSKHFKSEKDLFDHFNVPYEIIGDWSCGGGKRNVVVFSNEDIPFKVVNEYRHKIQAGKDRTLYDVTEITPALKPLLTDSIEFTKLEHNGKLYFGKNRLYYGNNIPNQYFKTDNKSELNNIATVYNSNKINHDELVNFYGESKRHGIIFEWVVVKDIPGKIEMKFDDLELIDMQSFYVDGKIIYTDFER